jgi:hypothetical protein
MGIYPVTQAQWRVVMGRNPSALPLRGDHLDRAGQLQRQPHLR